MSSINIEQDLSVDALQVHRALASLQEEVEAIDYYNQRADRAEDGDLRAILIHNRDEEIEHAVMLLEHLRRRMPEFEANMKRYLFTAKPVTDIEAGGTPAAKDLGLGALKLSNRYTPMHGEHP